jgi:D-beta-D-heptose 7-phosphate kinase/D-beta-D-heptose 1-phosphate adenosyltransferase
MSRIVVIGDAMLDRDLHGIASRLAPDAPVPVVDLHRTVDRPGGAALAALLTAYDGHDVHLVAGIGDDESGSRLRALLANALTLHDVPIDGSTPRKTRVRGGDRAVLRIDEGTGRTVTAHPRLRRLLAGADAVLVADYGRDAATVPDTRAAIGVAASSCPVVWDPHPRGAVPVRGARLVTPNDDEAAHFTDHTDVRDLESAGRRAARLVREWGATAVCVTRGRAGAVLSFGGSTPLVIPTREVSDRDPCGAGDRFAATVTAALASGAVPSEAVVAAVGSASRFVAGGGAGTVGVGPAPVTRGAEADRGADCWGLTRDVRAEGGTVVATGGCFDLLHAGHIAVLEAARRLGDCLVVCLNSDASVRRLKGVGRPLVPQHDRERVLAALGCVGAVVIFDEDTPEAVLRRLRPDVWAKGGDYGAVDLPEAEVVRSWGGSVALLPYLAGRSTSRLVASAQTDRVG